jgi:flavin-binding protein dodecin
MSTRTRLKAAVQVPQRRRTVVRRPLNQPDGETPVADDQTLVEDDETLVADDATSAEDGETLVADDETPAEDGEAPAKKKAPSGGKRPVKIAKATKKATPTASRQRRRPPLVVVCLTVALVAATAAAVVTGYQWFAQRSVDQAHQEAMAAAKQTTVNFVSVSAATVDRDLKRVTDGATGEFKDEFARGAPQVRAAVVENNVDSRGNVLRAGFVSGDGDSAVVLVAVDATVKNVSAPQGRLSHYRIQVEVSKDAKSGRWLVSKLQFVG